MNAVCLADEEDDRFAHPDGEDSFGPRYEAREAPSEMTVTLNEQGEYELESFINLTIRRDESECWVIGQVPAAGSILTGPGIVDAELRYTCDGFDEHRARLRIHLVDITPPEISVELTSNATPQVSFGNVLRYVGSAAVVPVISTFDACDANPAREYLLNGEPYEFGTPITGDGLYFLNVNARDVSENENTLSLIFEIRPRPSHTVAAVVSSTECEFDQQGVNGVFRATIMMSSAELDHRDFLLSSVRVMLRKADGSYYPTTPIPIKGGVIPHCLMFQDHLASVEIDDCVIIVEVESPFIADPPNECPAELVIVGVGVENGEIKYEWGARAANVADTHAHDTLLAMVGKAEPCGPPGPPPPPPPPPDCQLVQQLLDWPDVCVVPWTASTGACCIGTSGTRSQADASAAGVGGNSLSQVWCNIPGLMCSASSSCDASGVAVLYAQMVGDCCLCEITFSADASVRAFAKVTGFNTFTGSANASGSISFNSPCGGASASASATAPPNGPVMSGSDGFSCTVNTCDASLLITTSAHVDTDAAASATTITDQDGNIILIISWSKAEARLTTGLINFSVTGNGSPCDPGGCEDP